MNKILAKKHFGQNFLQDESVLTQIIQSIPKLKSTIEIIEIGTGLGDLTNKLLSLGSITTYEVDKELVPYLKEHFKQALNMGALRLEVGDILQIWKKENLREKPYFLISNLPYYIATPLIIKAIKDSMCQGFLVMTQKEVALKFCANVGESDFSALSVLIKSIGESKLLFDVPPQCFNPPPKVISSVFLFTKTKYEENDFLEKLEKLLKIAFNMPRKTLFNNLAKSYDKTKILECLQKLDINTNKRPHEIDTFFYHQLLKFL
ncbi:16S rRNA (adenine(1518)-N(6)/adenine(1519)-N(6))-dimethyltransferase RsmA [Helicobacter mesocricetorum]|uniref:16S rRNA (adenine(1518)-N(6)/adenine(1519)-N(6))- dimethyltransferase RsmA n=1 Tax=Helicobacter mesocricetorum TaxID=87012 RepID=UPI000CF0E382|nr:16S rRNA (adenine(1518)-N(6)/adenine(1519)-N(6))-dimethyltransferase RsmA [Helicobacter mesocricetorum]